MSLSSVDSSVFVYAGNKAISGSNCRFSSVPTRGERSVNPVARHAGHGRSPGAKGCRVNRTAITGSIVRQARPTTVSEPRCQPETAPAAVPGANRTTGYGSPNATRSEGDDEYQLPSLTASAWARPNTSPAVRALSSARRQCGRCHPRSKRDACLARCRVVYHRVVVGETVSARVGTLSNRTKPRHRSVDRPLRRGVPRHV